MILLIDYIPNFVSSKSYNHAGHRVVCVGVKFHEILHGDILFDILEHVPLLFHIVSLLFEN
jgi:hypothetical protein